MEQFMDLIQTPSVVVPILSGLLAVFGVLALIGMIIYAWPDDIDRKLEEAEAQRSARRAARMQSSDAPPAHTLEEFYQNYDQDPLPALTPAERMECVGRGSSTPQTRVLVDMATDYGFALEKNTEGHSLCLVDTRHQGLKHNRYDLSYDLLFKGSPQEWIGALRRARSNINRRALRQGLEFESGRRGPKPKLA